jgi:imidazolonepropionase-like amidohydrolase
MNELSLKSDSNSKLIQLTEGKTTVLQGGRLIDGTGSDVLENSVIVIEADRIVDVGKMNAVNIPDNTDVEVIDTSGKIIMPGLFDCHIHLTGVVTFDAYRRYLNPSDELKLLQAAVDAAVMLEYGFTTLRDVGGKPSLILKRAFNQGIIVGPRLHAAGPALTVTGGHGDWLHFPYDWVKNQKFRGWPVDGVEECRKAVRFNFRNGADLIKIIASGGGITNTAEDLAAMGIPEFSSEELKTIVSEAHTRRGKVAAHTTGAQATRQALDAGVDTIEHGFIQPPDYDILDLMAESGVSLIPTLSVLYRSGYEGDEMGVWRGGQEAGKRFLELNQEMVAEAKRRGVNVALGTDGVGHMGAGRSGLELRLLVDSGFTALEAITVGTRNSALAMGIEDKVGTLEPGKLADILILNKDPLQEITILEEKNNISTIIKSNIPLSVTH